MVQETATTTTPENAGEAAQHPAHLTLEDAELLGHDLKKLLVRSQNELVRGNAREKVEQLERWVESYRRGLAAAHKISSSGISMLAEAREQLHLALQEQLRLEDEGGNPLTKEQSKQIDDLNAAVRRMDQLIPVVESSFPIAETPEETSHPEAA